MSDPAIRIVNAMVLALDATRDFENGEGKFLLWNTLLAACTTVHYCSEAVHEQQYLDATLHLLHMEHGVCVYTVRQGQVNLNVAVPRAATAMKPLVHHALVHFARVYDGYAVDISALRGHMDFHDLPDLCVRRFVCTRKHVRDLVYDPAAQTLTLLGTTLPVVGVLRGAGDLGNFKPLTRLHGDDADGTVYWHRAQDGTLVTLTNPHLEAVEPLPFPPPVAFKTVLASVPTHIQGVIASMCGDTVEDVLYSTPPAWVPKSFRRVLVDVAQRRFGIQDAILLEAETLFHTGTPFTHVILEMCVMGDVLRACIDRRVMTVYVALEKVCSALEQFAHEARWMRWFFESSFVFKCILALDVAGLRRALKRYTPCRALALHALKQRLGEWTCLDVAKAKVLAEGEEEGGANVPSCIAEELQRHVERSERAAHEVVVVCHDPPAPGELKPRRRAPAARPMPRADAPAVAACVPSPPTHAALVARLARVCGFPLALIGSGVFHAASDADVVVTVEGQLTLADAYAHVGARTGWVPTYARVPEDRVVTLRGTFEGVLIDAQVWRGAAAHTPAEAETRRALALTHRLATEADAEARQHVRALHAWTHAAGLKGHRWCRLPGVAVTCAAIVLSATRGTADTTRLPRLLEALRDVLRHEAPAVDFTEQTSTEHAQKHHHARPHVPFAVRVDDHNLATRLTRATTRHLLDCAACALDTSDARLCAAAVYAEWRTQHMLPCARLRPRDARAVLQTLHASLLRLDGHPLVDSVYVEEVGEEAVCVHVTLDANADACTYGFREDDRVFARDSESGGGARVHRGACVWDLVAVRRPPTVGTWKERGSVCDLLALDAEWSVPNAPSLSTDVLLCFDHPHWEAL